jgi:hypothetical protein
MKKTIIPAGLGVMILVLTMGIGGCGSGAATPEGVVGPQGPAGSQGLQGETGPTGLTGPQGLAGADGQLRIYGNGSAGARVVSVSGTMDDTNFQYTDFTVNAGVTFSVPSGTVIRCTGTFTNNGTITVLPGCPGGQIEGTDTGQVLPNLWNPDPGISLRAPENGEIGDTTRRGGRGGTGLSAFQAQFVLIPGPKAGGGGAGTMLGGTGAGGSGGGSLVVLAQTGIVNAGVGQILADGTMGVNGTGGGGGGVIILASPGTVTNSGIISTQGGAGNDSNNAVGPGGGGGGGIVHLLAPTIQTGGGTINVSGGAAGAVVANVGSVTREGGSGGGACGGNGGDGGGTTGGPISPANPGTNGADGYSVQSLVDPTALF